MVKSWLDRGGFGQVVKEFGMMNSEWELMPLCCLCRIDCNGRFYVSACEERNYPKCWVSK